MSLFDYIIGELSTPFCPFWTFLCLIWQQFGKELPDENLRKEKGHFYPCISNQ